MAEDKMIARIANISEDDIEKESLRPSDLDGVAGGVVVTALRDNRPWTTGDQAQKPDNEPVKEFL
jgi:hypothetical protein